MKWLALTLGVVLVVSLAWQIGRAALEYQLSDHAQRDRR